MTISNPWYENQAPKPEPEDAWYENPWTFVYAAIGMAACIASIGLGIFWNAVGFMIALAIASNLYTFTEQIPIIDPEAEWNA